MRASWRKGSVVLPVCAAYSIAKLQLGIGWMGSFVGYIF